MDPNFSTSPEESSDGIYTKDNHKLQQSTSNTNLFKTLTEKRNINEGRLPKRRGPKPDSKPASTRRQELNRQAQRTHRERKELYIKQLEDEVLRLKEIYSTVSNDRDKLAHENQQLKTALRHNRKSSAITIEKQDDFDKSSTSKSETSYTHGSRSAFTPSLTSLSTASLTSPPPHVTHANSFRGDLRSRNQPGNTQGHTLNMELDYNQTGIDFVLTLEKPCMNHLPWLLERATETGGEPCGHAMMATCPPEPFPELTPDIPFGYSNVNGDRKSGQRTWELSRGDLSTLLNLCQKFNLDGEITPVMAWGMILAHPRLAEMKQGDFGKLAEDLLGKVRCYGFGAVMEEFEVRDALESMLSAKSDFVMTF